MYSFLNFEPERFSMSDSNRCFLTCIQISQEAGQVVWHFHLFQNFPQFIVFHTVKGFVIVNKAEVDFFLELSSVQFSSVQSLSRVQLFATPWIAACQVSLSITNSQSLLTHAHRVGDAIQPSHPLSSPSPPAPSPSQHQGLFQWVNSLHEVAKVLEFQLQHQSLQWTPRTYLLQDGLVGSPCSPRDSQESSTPQFKSISYFFNNPTDVGNLISGSSAFSKSCLNIWKFMVHILLKSGLKNFEHYFASMWDECNCAVVWAFFGIVFLRDWNENWPFPVLWPLLSFPSLRAYWVQSFHSIIFEDLK